MSAAKQLCKMCQFVKKRYPDIFMPVVGAEAAHIPFSVGEDTETQNYQKDSTIKLNLNVYFSCAGIKGTEHP